MRRLKPTTPTTPPLGLQKVKLSLVMRGENDRTVFDDNSLTDLAADIKSKGVISPPTYRIRKKCSDKECGILLYPDQQVCPACGDGAPTYYYEIVAGERRTRAARLAGLEEIEAFIKDLTDEQADSIMLSENVHRVDIDPVDEGFAYRKRIKNFGWSIPQCAEKAKVSERRVSDRLKLCDLVPEAHQLIRTKQMNHSWGEVMFDLDHNRQRIALQYFVKNDRPLRREFSAICQKLLEEQNTQSLFDDTAYIMTAAINQSGTERTERYLIKFPTDSTLPTMKRVGTIGASFEAYIHQLSTSTNEHERNSAPIVGRIYEAMLSQGMAHPTKK